MMKHYRMPSTVIAGMTAAALSLTALSAHAAIIKNLEFNVDGVLPTAEDTSFGYSDNVSGSGETDLYSVSGGLLRQRTFLVNGNASYGFADAAPSGGGLDSALSLVMEARVKIIAIDGRAGAFFQAIDEANRYSVFFTSGGIDLVIAGTTAFHNIAFDTSDFHTYRIESLGGTTAFDFYIDDILNYSGVARSETSSNGLNFGDGDSTTQHGADADWDFVRFSQPIAEAQVPEPAALALFGLGLAALGFVRRRRKAA